jgi:hypothetical protein
MSPMRPRTALLIAGLLLPFALQACFVVLVAKNVAFAQKGLDAYGFGISILAGFYLLTGVWPARVGILAVVYFPLMTFAVFIFGWTLGALLQPNGVPF